MFFNISNIVAKKQYLLPGFLKGAQIDLLLPRVAFLHNLEENASGGGAGCRERILSSCWVVDMSFKWYERPLCVVESRGTGHAERGVQNDVFGLHVTPPKCSQFVALQTFAVVTCR
jgi:hypothetical protein